MHLPAIDYGRKSLLLAAALIVVVTYAAATSETSAEPAAADVPVAAQAVVSPTSPASSATSAASKLLPKAAAKAKVTVPAKAAHAKPPTPKPTPVVRTATVAPTQRSVAAQPPRPAAQPVQNAWGCGAAIAYLKVHAAPSFTIQCPGNAFGRQAMTCSYHAPYCPSARVIAIAVPCPAAYKNEAHNSWVLLGRATGIDPYGSC